MGHVRGLVRVLPVAVIVGIVVAIAVYAFQSSTSTRYQADLVAQIVTPGSAATGQSGATSTDAATAAGPFVALSTDQQVIDAVSRAAGVSDAQFTVSAGEVPGIVSVSADGDSREQAAAIARAVVSTVDSTYRTRQQAVTTTSSPDSAISNGLNNLSTRLTALTDQLDGVIQEGGTAQREIAALTAQIAQLRSQATSTTAASTDATPTQRLILLAQPAGSVKAGTIPPAAIAAVIGLIAMILVAEILSATRSRRGKTVNREWARRLAETTSTPVDLLVDGTQLPAVTAAAVSRAASVLVWSSPGATDVASDLAGIPGAQTTLAALGPDAPAITDGQYGLAVVVVREGEAHRPEVAAAMETLTAWDIPARLLVVATATRGTLSLPGGLALAFRKPAAGGVEAPAGEAVADAAGSRTPAAGPAVSGPATDVPEADRQPVNG
ncbi:hypothetical protein [Williamsia maris]|uniref:hypothetical protein n=1 Tax=Williamsia maris TaxID=72806 RepID=UPI0020A30698|nr:hypothetical protein [Williamsia maris]